MAGRRRILLTHTPDARANYYSPRALGRLQSLGDVVLHGGAMPLDTDALLAIAKDCQVIVSDRATPVEARVFASLPALVAVLRVAVDIRNIDVAAASSAGVLVTHAGLSWVAAVSELAVGLMIDAARGISRANVSYKAGQPPEVRMGRQLAGATAGVIGYGPLGRRVCELLLALDMRVPFTRRLTSRSGASVAAFRARRRRLPRTRVRPGWPGHAECPSRYCESRACGPLRSEPIARR